LPKSSFFIYNLDTMKHQKRIIVGFCFLFFTLFSVYSQNDREKWVLEHYTKKEYMIPMRDGAKLFTAVYSPKDTTQNHPMLICRSPYSSGPYGEDAGMNNALSNNLYPYSERGYIFVYQDVRGRFMSEGQYENIRSFLADKKGTEIDEASDSYDTADWLVKNLSHNNGRIGVFGISYPGFYALMAGAANHPAIKAVSPQAPVFNWFIGDDFHHNGAFFLKDAFSFMDTFDQIRKKRTTEWVDPTVNYEGNDYDFFKNKSLKELTDTYFKDTRPFWSDMMRHPDYDDWWKARSAANACRNFKPAVLVVGGLFDAEDCYGAWNAYKEIRKQSPQTNCRIVFGPWFHGGWDRSLGDSLGRIRFESNTAELYQNNIQLPFFDYYLRDSGNLDSLKEATIFFTGENQWHTFSSWPTKVKHVDLYFCDNKSLSFSKPQKDGVFSQYVSDPNSPVPYDEKITQDRTREYIVNDQRFAEKRKDVITFQTDVLDKDLTLAGSISADLNVAISTTDADFVVKVIDVFPDGFRYGDRPDSDMGGYEMLVRGEVFRGRYRNSYTNPEAFVPGKPTEVKFDLPDVAHTFKKGHRLMVQVQSSWFPLVDMNPQQFINIYTCSSKDFVKSTVSLFHNATLPSKIVLPVLN